MSGRQRRDWRCVQDEKGNHVLTPGGRELAVCSSLSDALLVMDMARTYYAVAMLNKVKA